VHGTLECANFLILLRSTCAHYAMEGSCTHDVKQLTSLSTFVFKFTIGFSLGILQSPPLIYALPSVHYVHIYNKIFQKSSKRCGYSSRIASSCSQVVSLGPYQVHWTFTSHMDRLWSCLIFWSRMHTRCTWKVPSFST
jgi:hypothetical protein